MQNLRDFIIAALEKKTWLGLLLWKREKSCGELNDIYKIGGSDQTDPD